jgi:predicted CoA-binding protein
MPSQKETFFEHQTFAVIGNTDLKAFPKLTLRGLRRMGKKVHPVDLGGRSAGSSEKMLSKVDDLPEGVEAAVVEVPRRATMDVVEQLNQRGIKNLWLHMQSDSPEVLDFCKREGIDVRYGSCAVMYTGAGSYHALHRRLAKLFRRY